MADVFTINGVTLDPTTDDFLPIRFSERFGTIPTLTIQRRGVALPGLPDPWIGKEATWTNSSNLYFTGDVISMTPGYSQSLGWVLSYQCLGWRNRLDYFPHTDSNTGIDTSAYNLTLEDPLYNPARAGRQVGQILADVLVMTANAQAINAAGIGNYTGLPTSPVLPTVTTTDLAALTVIPPQPVYFNGEKFGSAVDGFLAQWAPNVRFWIDPTGNMRFLDIRTFTPTTFTMGTDPIEPSEISRDTDPCFQRVLVRGQPIATMAVLKQSQGQLLQNFTWNGYATNAAAIAAWTPAQFRQPGTAQDTGTCTCPTTTTITVTSSSGSTFWSADFWDQSHQQGTVNVSSSTITGVTQFWTARIIANTALTGGGTSTLTIDNPLPSTSYDGYTITGLAGDGSIVWTQYQIANTNLWPLVTKQSTYPQPFINAGGGVTLISSALGCVLWSTSGSAPFNSFPLAFTYNPTTGNVRFIAPTYFIANNAAPADVWVALPIQQNPNVAIEPPDIAGVPQYAGTSYTDDGLTRTLTITADFWRDPSQLSQLQAYASDVLDSVKDAVCEGSITYYGFYAPAMTFGMAVNVAGNDGDGAYTTGWEALNLPMIQVDIEWPQEAGQDYVTTMHGSSRTQHYSASMFAHPPQQFNPIGVPDGIFNPYGVSQPDTMGSEPTGNYEAMNQAITENFSTGPSASPEATDAGSPAQQSGIPRTPDEALGGGQDQVDQNQGEQP